MAWNEIRIGPMTITIKKNPEGELSIRAILPEGSTEEVKEVADQIVQNIYNVSAEGMDVTDRKFVRRLAQAMGGSTVYVEKED